MTNPLLKVDSLTMRFGGLLAINQVSFTLNKGNITALIGPNGAGKTTVFNCITGFYKPTSGSLMLLPEKDDGATYQLEALPGHEIAEKARVARTFQNIRLFPGLTVLENLLVAQHNPLMGAGFISSLFNFPGYKKTTHQALTLAKDWLNEIGLYERADDLAGSLAYGDQRRLEIARAMCLKPRLLCLDEPAAGLNPKESLDLNFLLRKIRNHHDTSLFLIEHDMSVVMGISDHIIVIDYGVKIADGTPDQVKNDPKVIAAYLGVEDEEVSKTLEEVKA